MMTAPTRVCAATPKPQRAGLFPALWDTKKSAERWLSKNPPEAIRDIIRVWGVLNGYRPKGQTSWSKALLRHGAEARTAIAAVLGCRLSRLG